MTNINQYDIKDIFTKDEFYIFNNFLKRNFKPFFEDVEHKNKIKKNIPHYDVKQIVENLFYKVRHSTTGDTNIYPIFIKFINFIKVNQYEDKELMFFLNQFPKPKYERKKWRTWKRVTDKIKLLKKSKLNIHKDIKNNRLDKKLAEEKLNNIDIELNDLKIRKKELGEKLK